MQVGDQYRNLVGIDRHIKANLSLKAKWPNLTSGTRFDGNGDTQVCRIVFCAALSSNRNNKTDFVRW